MILKIDQNFYFPDYFGGQPYYSYIIPYGHPSINFNVNISISAISYDFNNEKITQAVRGFAVLSNTNIYQRLDLLPTTENDPSVWRNGALVEKVEGPYQDGKVVTEIDLKKRVYYLATPNSQYLHNTQILSIKWEYQYNDGENVQFKKSVRSVINDKGVRKCRIDCGFLEKDDIFFIALYPFFKIRSEKVFNRTPTTNKEKSNQGVLIWSALVNSEFEQKVITICAELYGDERKIEMANALMAVMAVESARTFKAHIIAGQNVNTLIPPESITKDDFKKGENSSKAVGLIQFTQPALEQLGDFKGGSGFDKLHEVKLKYARMGEIKQLDKVRDYLYPKRKKIISPEDIYLQVFAPSGIGQDKSFVLYSSPSTDYKENASLDKEGNKNKKIEREELLKRYYKLYEEGKKLIRGVSNPSSEIDPIIGEVDNTGEWHHPLDNLELRGHYNGGWSPKSSTNDYDKNLPKRNNNHYGIDLYAPIGTPIYACVDGTAKYNITDPKGYGNRIFLTGKYKGVTYQFMYAHLSTYKPGKVKKGDQIGTTGQDGNASGQPAKFNHLHFEIRNSQGGKDLKLDPLKIIEELGNDVNTNPKESDQDGL
ncbi:MAG: M23 family metallopeptidase [Crocinitomicaceae bacterium]|nr:M23 family metallopeptidase [Crocinitomicaceae bacterium]